MRKALPTLYKKTSTGAIQQWSIHVEENVIVTVYGQKDGKLQEARDTITKGKNVGRANETTPIMQALAEAQSQWEKKKKKGYVESVDAASNGETDALIEGGVFPMLAKSFNKDGDKIKFPAYVQPKLDGHRCIAVKENGTVTLWSRTRKRITGVPHIERALERILRNGDVTDGELYNHDYKNKFEELSSFIRQATPIAGHEVVQYHVYDLVTSGPFVERFKRLSQLVRPQELRSQVVIRVDTHLVEDEDDMMTTFEDFLRDGYEGLMVRNTAGLYKVGGRSADLQKVKEFDDAEFKVVAVNEGRGKMAGKAVFTCTTKDGIEFDCKLVGKLEALADYIHNPKKALGRMLTVKYQGMTKYGKPRFPVGMRWREDV